MVGVGVMMKIRGHERSELQRMTGKNATINGVAIFNRNAMKRAD